MWVYDALLLFIGIASVVMVNTGCNSNINVQLIKKNSVSNKIVYIYLTFLPLIAISALRSINIGNDTKTYHNIFNISTYTSFNTFLELNASRWEKGFLILTKSISCISDNPQFLIAISSVISLFFAGRFIYLYSKKPALSIFLFITMRFYFFFMSNIRQSIALGLVLFSYDFIKKRKLIPFSIVILIATQFHSTAIVFFFAYFIERLKYKRKYVAVTALTTGFIFLGFNSLMKIILTVVPNKYLNYVNTSYYIEATNAANIANFIVVLSILIFGYIFKYNKNRAEAEISFYYLLISACIGFLSIKFGMLSRIQYYFYIFSIVMITDIIMKIKNKELKTIITLAIVILFYLYHITILILRPEWQHVYPYELFF